MEPNKKAHALLSSSSSSRWINCNPSARLTEHMEDTVSNFASEGTDAHSLCEYKLNKALGVNSDEPPKLDWYSQEMEECATGYASYVLEIIEGIKAEGKEPLVLVEQRLDYSKYVEDGFGTGDAVIVADGIINIVDYKHGRGILVNAENNSQMMIYALGALELFDFIFDIEIVRMTIYQPRLGNVSTFEMSKEDLLKWADEVLVPASKLAFKGEGEFHCGEWCTFCKAKSTCRERAKFNTKLAQLEFKEPPVLTDEEVIEVLLKVDGLVSWANDVKDFAYQEALKGKKWSGFKLVEGRSTRKLSNEDEVASLVEKAGFNPYERKIVGISELQKRMGKSKFIEIVEPFVIKPAGKPTLVLDSDKRPEYNSAKIDFMTTEEN